MQAGKRAWIYMGLTVPDGVGLVRRPRRTSRAVSVLLVGDEHAERLFAPLSLLVNQDEEISLHTDARRGTTLRAWAKEAWLSAHLGVFCPQVVLMAIDPRDMLARRVVLARCQAEKCKIVWIVPPGIDFSWSSANVVSLDVDDVSGYAAGAAKAWNVVR